MGAGKDVREGPACQTGQVNSATIAGRWHQGLAALWRPTGPPPRLSRWAWASDVILAVVVAALNAALSTADGQQPGVGTLPPDGPRVPIPPDVPGATIAPIAQYSSGPHTWHLVLAALIALPLVWRRRYPLAAFWVVLLASQATRHAAGLGPTVTLAAGVIAAYSAAMYSRYQALAIVSVLLGTAELAAAFKENVTSIKPGFVAVLVLIPVGLAANTIHTWRQRVRALEAAQTAATMLAVERERARIAYELHDVVSHNVSVMLVQAGAARKVMAAAPEKAQAALLAVESGGRAAMTELRHVMGLLMMSGEGEDSDLDGLAPPPGLAQVAALTARIRAAGVAVDLAITGSTSPLPTGVDLTAYRVVQEALTNAVKHAAGAGVSITIDAAPDALSIEVADTGGGPTAPPGAGHGRGLIGLRERLAVYGGTLEAGPSRGGYRVHAVIPTDTADLR